MFDRRAHLETLRDEAKRMFGFLRGREEREAVLGSPGRSPLAQDKVGTAVAEAFAQETVAKEALVEERRVLVLERQKCQEGLVELLKAVANRYRVWGELNHKITTVMVQQHPNEFRIDPHAGPGGELLAGLSNDDRMTLARLTASLAGMSRGKFTR